MKQTVLITGTSSGIGRTTAELFASRGWNVAATMRKPEFEKHLNSIAGIKCLRLDVHDIDSIRQAIKDTIQMYGSIDAVVNNAGFAVIGPFETTTEKDVRAQFETNVFGLMNVCREIIPVFRKNNKGSIINITSVGGRITFPLYSLYHSSKWAVEGFSESLQYELRPFNIKVRIIEPGPVKTDFYDRSRTLANDDEAYKAYTENAIRNMDKFGESGVEPRVIAEVIYKSAMSSSDQLRYPADIGAKAMLAAKGIMPSSWFRKIVEKVVTR